MTTASKDAKHPLEVAFFARKQDGDGIAALRNAVRYFDWQNESCNQRFSAEELLRIVEAAKNLEHDFFPDEWEPRQLEEAARYGATPRWEEGPRGYVAVYREEGGFP